MRAVFVVALLLWALGAQAQKTVYDAIQDGKNVGSLTIDRKVAGSTLTQSLLMNIRQPNRPVAIIKMTTIYDGKGFPKSKKAELKVANNSSTVTAIFFASGNVKLTAVSKGQTHTREVKAPGNAGLVDPGVWWFISGNPKPGATYNYQSLNPVTLKWVESTTRYVGLSNLKIGGIQVKAHQVTTVRSNKEKSTTWLDDKGMPWMLDQGQMKFIRR